MKFKILSLTLVLAGLIASQAFSFDFSGTFNVEKGVSVDKDMGIFRGTGTEGTTNDLMFQDKTVTTPVKLEDLVTSSDNVFAVAEFEAYADNPQQDTTSDGWVTKNNYPYTTNTKTAGTYVIDHSSQLCQSDKFKNVGHRVQWRTGTTGTWIDLVEINNSVTVANGCDMRTGFNLITLVSDSVFQVRIQWGQTIDGGTGSIKFAGIKISKVATP